MPVFMTSPELRQVSFQDPERQRADFAVEQLKRRRRRAPGLAAISGANPAEASAIQDQQAPVTGGGAMKFDDVTQPEPATPGLTAGQMQAGTLAASAAGASLQQASGGEGAGNVAGSALSGAATGATIGAMGGPYGAAIGAAVGAGIGVAKGISGSKRRREERRRKATARKFEAIANIRQREGAQKQQALQSMMDGLRSAFIGGR